LAEGLEGDITVPGLSASDGADDQEFNTLDEPVRETVVSVLLSLSFNLPVSKQNK